MIDLRIGMSVILNALYKTLRVVNIIIKGKGKLSTCEHRLGCPSPSRNELDQTHFSLCGARYTSFTTSLLPSQHNLLVLIYTPGLRGVIMVKCLTQRHNALTVKVHKPTTFCLWTHHWSARPLAPNHYHYISLLWEAKKWYVPLNLNTNANLLDNRCLSCRQQQNFTIWLWELVALEIPRGTTYIHSCVVIRKQEPTDPTLTMDIFNVKLWPLITDIHFTSYSFHWPTANTNPFHTPLANTITKNWP